MAIVCLSCSNSMINIRKSVSDPTKLCSIFALISLYPISASIRVEDSELYFSFIFIFIILFIYILILNLELGYSVTSHVTVTNCHTEEYRRF